MKKILVLLMLTLASLTGFTQGVNFDTTLSWAQIKAKAKAENKYIFIDFKATWCVPCKQMDANVYNNAEIAQALDKDFISIKVQADKIAADNNYVRSWYEDAASLVKQYKITGYPTLLFLSPAAEPMNRAVGYMQTNELKKLILDVKNPSKQYPALLEKYKDGKLKPLEIVALSKMAKEFKDEANERKLSRDYINNYLINQPDSVLYTLKNLHFISSFVTSKDKKAFKLFYPDPTIVNSFAKVGDFKSWVVGRVISEEIVDSVIFKDAAHTQLRNPEPNWNLIANLITKKFGSAYVKSSLFGAKMGFYFYSKWKNYDKAAKAAIDHYGIEGKGMGDPNAICWDLFFTRINDKEMLKIAANWMVNSFKEDTRPEDFDTAANLFYKIGNIEEAIKYQNKAIESEAAIGKRANRPVRTEFTETLAKMKSGVKTWAN